MGLLFAAVLFVALCRAGVLGDFLLQRSWPSSANCDAGGAGLPTFSFADEGQSSGYKFNQCQVSADGKSSYMVSCFNATHRKISSWFPSLACSGPFAPDYPQAIALSEATNGCQADPGGSGGSTITSCIISASRYSPPASERTAGVAKEPGSAASPAWILNDLSLEIPAGSIAAFVGASGSGKTTAARLLQRFYDPQSGVIIMDGADIAALPVPSLRRIVAVVDQDTSLLARSVLENVALGLDDVDMAAVRDAVERAQAAEFVADAGGLGTLVGERGGRLSGGQRQRLALARMLLRDPLVAVIDEGTSALDGPTEAAFMAALLGDVQNKRRRTTVLIAHRLATVARADVVFVFERGRVIESGAPDALRAAGGAFARLLAAQGLGADRVLES
jgi:ABC-type multidrug transport system fused ATPase/permease subunit